MTATPAEKFPTPIREPKLGTFHRPAHGFGRSVPPEAAELRLSGPMTGEQKLGEGLRKLPFVGEADVSHEGRGGPEEGCTEALIRARLHHRAARRAGAVGVLATATPQRIRSGGKVMEVATLRLTGTGRRMPGEDRNMKTEPRACWQSYPWSLDSWVLGSRFQRLMRIWVRGDPASPEGH